MHPCVHHCTICSIEVRRGALQLAVLDVVPISQISLQSCVRKRAAAHCLWCAQRSCEDVCARQEYVVTDTSRKYHTVDPAAVEYGVCLSNDLHLIQTGIIDSTAED